MKVLVTGASGRLGQASVVSIRKASHDVITLTRRHSNHPEGVREYIVDLDDAENLENIFRLEKPDVVIHLAAITGAACDDDIDLTRRVNIDLTKQLAILADKYGANKFIFASTAAVYNQTKLSPTDENSNVEPLSFYGRSKLEAERSIESIALSSTTQFTSFRIFNLYGPNFDNSLVTKLLKSSANSPVQLAGLENFYRDYIHADDVIQAMFDYIEAKGISNYEVFNIASGNATSNAQLIDKLRQKNKSLSYEITGDQNSYSWADINKASSVIGFSAKHSEL